MADSSNDYMNLHEWGGVVINPKCSNMCLFCNPPKGSQPEIRRQEVNILKNLMDFKKRGISSIEISGADPIEYEKIIPLIKYIKKIGFGYVQLSTHGRKLCEKKFLNEMMSSGLDKIRIPLYGANAKTHDFITGSKGSFRETVAGLMGLKEYNSDIEVQLSCLVMRANKNQLKKIVLLARYLGAKNFYFSVPCILNENVSYYLPFRDIGTCLREAYYFSKKISYHVEFMEIPFCVFGFHDSSINNKCIPPDLGKNCQPPERLRSHVTNIPLYRLKRKVSMCKKCRCSPFCDGFFVNDVDNFGTGNIVPIS